MNVVSPPPSLPSIEARIGWLKLAAERDEAKGNGKVPTGAGRRMVLPGPKDLPRVHAPTKSVPLDDRSTRVLGDTKKEKLLWSVETPPAQKAS